MNLLPKPENDYRDWEKYLELSELYFAVVRENGVPWFEDVKKRAPVLKLLGLPVDTPPLTLRKALWQRRHNKGMQ